MDPQSPRAGPTPSLAAPDVAPISSPDTVPASLPPAADVIPTASADEALDVGSLVITIPAVDAGPTAGASPTSDRAKEIPSPMPKLPPPPSPPSSSSSPTAGLAAVAGPLIDVAPTPDAAPLIGTGAVTSPTLDALEEVPLASSSVVSGPAVDVGPTPDALEEVPLASSSDVAGPAVDDVGLTPVETKPILTAAAAATPTETTESSTAEIPAVPMTDLSLCDPVIVEPAPGPGEGPTSADGPLPPPAPTVPCPHSDFEIVRKLAQILLPGLATAAVDSTTGNPFHSPATVAVDLRRDLTDHVAIRSESLVPQSLALLAADPAIDGLPDLDDPVDLLSHLIEEFNATKRNLLGRVSGWFLSDSREDKIDDFVQELELNNFWKLDRRETIAESLLKNLDYKNKFHCSMLFNSEEELEIHKKDCSFRPVACRSEGCKVKYCKMHEEQHSEVCPYKVLECEQRCGDRIMRREMDRHCITVCRMNMMNCPFYHLGCPNSFPQCQLMEHCRENVATHLLCVMEAKNEEGLGEEELKARAENLEKVLNLIFLLNAYMFFI